MLIAIHHREGAFSARWIEYCSEHGLPYKIVNCYDSDIVTQLRGADALLWHWTQTVPQDLLMALDVIRAAEKMGLKVFPKTETCWHFDDKIAQKYLLEAVGAPLVPTYVFYTFREAAEWIDHTSFPKVFKLRRGAGSANVWLIRNPDEALRLARRAFGSGFTPVRSYFRDARTKLAIVRRKGNWKGVLKRVPRSLLNVVKLKGRMPREKGYFYCQDFMPSNLFDTRVTVIGNRVFGFIRKVRPGDFRASGSGVIDYDTEKVNPECVRVAFEVARKVGAQSLAFDFVMEGNQPLITEVSYCYLSRAVYECPGHWDDALVWHEGHVWPEDAILEDLLAECDPATGGGRMGSKGT